MSPEQLSGREVTIRSDLYALGLVLYELFTGKPAFKAGSLEELKRLRLDSQPSTPTNLHQDLDPAIESVILRCLKKDPADRPTSAKAVLAALPGGDPLAAALAAGETPSPEMVAEAGASESLRPLTAFLLAALALVLYFAGTYFQGTLTLSHYLPMDKPPQVLVDRAKQIIAQLGYTEPVYSQPTDSAFGFYAQSADLREIAARDSSTERWEQLRQRPDVLAFWYRQSPFVLQANPSPEAIVSRGVSLINPSEEIPGNIEVLLDGVGRLRRFRYSPKRFSSEDMVQSEFDWAELFGLAGLDFERFLPVRPRYQRWLAPDERWAWLGSREDSPETEWRVEAGSYEGRIALFNVGLSPTLEPYSRDPKPARADASFIVLFYTSQILLLALMGIAVLLARRNWHRGRCDKRAARRLGVCFGVLMLVVHVLWSQSLFKEFGLVGIWAILASSVFVGMFAWTCFLAVEPYGRRVWPALFVSSSRLLSRERFQWRDSQVGRSVLLGVLFGACAALIYPANTVLNTWWQGSPAFLLQPAWVGMVGQRSALAFLLETLFGSALGVLVPLLMLVVFLSLTKRKTLSILLTVITWPIVYVFMSPSPWAPTLLFCIVALVVLMRLGLVALAVFLVVDRTYLLSTTNLMAWYSQASLFAAVFVLLLLAYGVWASTAGRKILEDSIE
jgi:serine/threonine-protein kinase